MLTVNAYAAPASDAPLEPVTITRHGRDSLVLVSSETFEQMKAAYYAPKHYYAWELPDEIVKAIEAALPPEESKNYNHELDE